MQVDPRFREARSRAEARRKRRLWRRLIWGGGLVATLVGLAVWAVLSGLVTLKRPDSPLADQCAVPEDDHDHAAETNTGFAAAFIDLPGDPMILRFAVDDVTAESRTVLRPGDIPAARVGASLILLQDMLIPAEERLITILPSKREDFAFFQAQRQAGLTADAAPALTEPPKGEEGVVTVTANTDSSWGSALADDPCATTDQTLSYAQTLVDNTTSIATAVPDTSRKALFEDVVLRLKEPRDLAALLVDNGFDPAASPLFAAEAVRALPALGTLAAGQVLALRRGGGVGVPVQLGLFGCDGPLGVLARNDAGQMVAAKSPWPNGFSCVAETAEVTAAQPADSTAGKYRLLDAFYSAALRNGVPGNVVGEAIILMSQVFDMDAFADSADRLELLYGAEAGADADSAGQVLYIALRGSGRSFECYVARPAPDQPYACFAPNLPGGKGGAGTGGGGTLAAGMSLPVPQGTLTSTFGPRLHPKLGVVRMHKGVDWAAPVGTPVLAALPGKVKSLAKSDSYGNLAILDHGGGIETRYAHLDGFAAGLAEGQDVQAGQQIGQLGNTGLSTGPHLHFEFYRNGDAINPLDGSGTHLAGDEAVDILTDRIIAVESGGKADAKNPLSSATGLGQFIESTWLRMMRTYRPDLVSTLSQEALLALRTDPTVSREMVRNLAREGEAYLRARGHDITAGRLYLCHFLGMEGAHILLSADRAAAAADVVGPDVERANRSIITGRTAAQVIDWAEGKMAGHSAAPAAPPPLPPEVAAYRDMIVALVGSPT